MRDQADCVCCHAKPLSGKAKMLLGGGFDIDAIFVAPKCQCKILLHERNVWGKLGGLRDHGGIDIADAVAILRQQSGYVLCKL